MRYSIQHIYNYIKLLLILVILAALGALRIYHPAFEHPLRLFLQSAFCEVAECFVWSVGILCLALFGFSKCK